MLSEAWNERLLTGLRAGPLKVQFRLGWLVRESKYTSAGAARSKVYWSCSPVMLIVPLVTLPKVKAALLGFGTGWTLTVYVLTPVSTMRPSSSSV